MIVGPLQFDQPWWLLLIPVLVPLVILPALRSMAGLSGLTRIVAVSVRVLVILLLAATLAEPHIRDESKDVAVTVVLDTSKSVSQGQQQAVASYIAEAQTNHREERDRLGVVTAARQALVQSLASHLNDQVELNFTGNLDATNIASAMQLALAIMPNDAANRVLLASDGNETEGSLLQVAEVYRAAGIPIDVLPLTYTHDEEVIIDRLVAPATARIGQNVNLKVVMTATHEARGRLSILQNGQVIDLDPGSPETSVPVVLKEGTNTIPVLVPPSDRGPQEYEAVFAPYIEGGRAVGDSMIENNRSLAVTFVTGEARVLIISETRRDAEPLRLALMEARVGVDVVDAANAPSNLVGMNAYDGIVLIDQSAYSFSAEQQEDLRRYVHDSGGGLVMIGGENAFGAGGWIGSPLEDALPVKLDPPEKREMPRGALALIVHSVEIPQGVYYGKQVCIAAGDALSRLDYIGITEYNMTGGTDWVYNLQPIGDKVSFRRAVNNLSFGDMPDFAPSLQLAVQDLSLVDAGQKHVIIISDGDPSAPSKALLQRFIDAKITISTVGIGVHNAGDGNRMKGMAMATGGRHYDVKQNQVAELPKIFMKEAVTVRRNLIEEGGPFEAIVNAFGSEPMRG
ncbi:MAG: VWA domain-containing protein, partial [Phycisphaerales bacterium]|nr:VWA domain-containing protein [Phycisphaerales bacterium]